MNSKMLCILALTLAIRSEAQTVQIDLNALGSITHKTNGTKITTVFVSKTNIPDADKEKIFKSILPGGHYGALPQPNPRDLHLIKPYDPDALPFRVTMVETEEAKDAKNISREAAELLQMKDYNQLDALAAKYRSSKESYSSGYWKLDMIYCGLILPYDASEQEWESRLTNIQNWIIAKPESITARVALADNFVNYAWKARGGGDASTVTEKARQLFSQRILQAANVLVLAKDLKERCPRFQFIQMEVGLAEGVTRSQFDRTFNQAINNESDYESYYVSRATFLLPRWYGAVGEWEKDLEKSADRIGGEEGDMLYAQVVWSMETYFSNIFNENKLSWDRVNKGLEAMEKRFPNSIAVKNRHAFLAVLAGDKKTAQNCFNSLQGKMDLSVWKRKEAFVATYLYFVK